MGILSQTLDRSKCIIVFQDRLRVIGIEGKEIVYMKNTCKMITIEKDFSATTPNIFSYTKKSFL